MVFYTIKYQFQKLKDNKDNEIIFSGKFKKRINKKKNTVVKVTARFA